MSTPIDYNFNYEAFAHALLDILDLRGDVQVFPYRIAINPHGHLDGAIVIWLLAHATPDQVAAAEQRARAAS